MTRSRGRRSEADRPPAVREPDESSEGEPGRLPLLPDLMRRALALGLTGIFTTEQAIRQALGDTLPKDWIDFAVDQSERARTEFLNRLAGELARVLEGVDLEALAQRLLERNTIEVRAEIRLKAPEEGGRSGRGKGQP